MAIRVQRHANVSKPTLLDGLDVSPLKWLVCGCALWGLRSFRSFRTHLVLTFMGGTLGVRLCSMSGSSDTSSWPGGATGVVCGL